jgi:hypothetical protein
LAQKAIHLHRGDRGSLHPFQLALAPPLCRRLLQLASGLDPLGCLVRCFWSTGQPALRSELRQDFQLVWNHARGLLQSVDGCTRVQLLERDFLACQRHRWDLVYGKEQERASCGNRERQVSLTDSSRIFAPQR